MAVPKTLKEIRERVQVDLDLQEEKFIVDSEINQWINDGIREAEAEISTLGPEIHNYFLAKKTIDTVANQSEYKLPAQIYADKVRAIIFDDNGINTHKITPIKRFDEVPYILQGGTDQYFRYIMTQEKKGTRMELFPTPATTSTTKPITIWYIRNAKELDVDTDTLDIPEFVNFILQYTKVECLKKEGHPDLANAKADLEQERQLMIDTLRTRVVDDENIISPDVQHYVDMLYQ